MRSILVAFLLGLISFVAYAQTIIVEKPVVCSDTKTVIETVSGPDWKEQPFWTGKDTLSRYVMMVNEKSKTWTLIQFKDDIACVIGTGEGHNVIKFKITS